LYLLLPQRPAADSTGSCLGYQVIDRT